LVLELAYLTERALTVEYLEAGGASNLATKSRHTKTVPFTIFARAREGWYQLHTPAGSVKAHENEGFAAQSNISLTIGENPNASGRFTFDYLHLRVTLFETIDVSSLLQLPAKLGLETAQKVGVLIDACRTLDQDQSMSSLTRAVERNEIGFAAARLLLHLTPLRPGATELIERSQRLAPVFSLIRKRMGEDLSIAELAGAAALSVPRFHALFKQRMGMTPMAYVKQVRLLHAAQQLVLREDPVSEIAYGNGFRNAFHFAREFKKQFGETPTGYRRSHLNRREGT